MAISPGRGIRSLVVVGGGTAGYFTALAVKRRFPAIDITLVESSKIPIIGVGEATSTLILPFLHRQLGIDSADLYHEVRPTWKLGIKFIWGLPGNDYYFTYPFGFTRTAEAYALDGHIAHHSLVGTLMAVDRVPIVRSPDGEIESLLARSPYAYHLDNRPFVDFLAKRARREGIRYIDAEVENAVVAHDGENIERLILDGERECRADLYVDATGFRSLLIEKTLGSPFISYASSLFCDSAVVGNVPQRGPIQPYTTAETMDAGWCWRIPVEGEDHRGYVFSSAHLTADQARAEMEAANPGLGETWSLRFRSGRHADFWKGNTVAVGNAYGFVEPLQSTALHMVIIEIAYLISGLEAAERGEPDRAAINRQLGAHWDYLRWFLALHYKFNRKRDTEFWRTCRETADVSGMQDLLDHHAAVGPWDGNEEAYQLVADPTFGSPGLLITLLGQQVPCPPPAALKVSPARWEEWKAENRSIASRALLQAEALDVVRRRPEILQEVVMFSGSWLVLSERGAGEWQRLQATVCGGGAALPPAAAPPTSEQRKRRNVLLGPAARLLIATQAFFLGSEPVPLDFDEFEQFRSRAAILRAAAPPPPAV